MNRLKRWESPRKTGRNNKGKGGSARSRQKKKQMKLLRKKLKESSDSLLIIFLESKNKDDYIKTSISKGYFQDVLSAGKSYDVML